MQYSIVFNGKIRPGATLEEARGNLAEMFKLKDPAVLDRVFSGQTVVLKKGLSEDEARNQEMILYMAGAICELRSNAPPPPAPAPQPEAVAAPVAVEPPPPPSPPPEPAARPLVSATSLRMREEPTLLPAIAVAPPPAQTEGDYTPAALRGRHAPEADGPPQDKLTIINHGRVGEGLLDPLHAPWDPAFVPDVVKGLSWAGFMAPLLWGTFNGLRLSFLPLIAIRLLRHYVPAWAWTAFYLAFGAFYLVKGRELAWENKQWRNAEHFLKVQRNWTIGAAAIFLLSMSGLVYLVIAERRAEHMVAAATALAAAEEKVERAANPDERAAAVAERQQRRSDFLAIVPDPALRERERQAFAEQDQQEQESAAQQEQQTESRDAPPPSE